MLMLKTDVFAIVPSALGKHFSLFTRLRACLVPMLLAALCQFALVAPAAQAATAAAGSAHGLETSLTLAPLIGVNAQLAVGPLPSGVSRTAPPDYSANSSTASATGALGVLGTVVSTGVLQASTTANLAADTSTSTASVDNLNVGLIGLIGLTANQVQSTASVTCNAGSLAVSGTTTLTNPALTLLGLGVGVSGQPAPNTQLSVLGIQVTLNEQVASATGISVNAVHVRINNALLAAIGRVSGDIVIAQSTASLTSTCPVSAPLLPDLKMTIGAPSPAFVAGQQSLIPVTVANVGTGASPGPHVVTLAIPGGFTVPAAFTSGAWSCLAPAAVVSCSMPSALAAGASTAFNVPFTPSAGAAVGPYTFSGNAQAAPGETNLADNAASMQASVATAPASGTPNLQMSIGAPSPAFVAGQQSQIPVTISNVGTAASPGPHVVTLSVPTGFTVPGAFTSGTWSCTDAAGTITCTNPAALGPGLSTSFNVPFTPGSNSASGPHTFSGNAQPAAGETNLADNSASMQASVAAAPTSGPTAPDLQMAIGDPSPALTAGQTSRIPVTLTNVGTATAPASQSVTITLPADVSVPASFTSGDWTCNVSNGTVACGLNAALPAGASSAFTVPVTPLPTLVGTQPTFSVTATAAPGETSLGNNTATLSAPVSAALEINYQDVWWNPQESGWGVGIFHQGDTVFFAIYVYGNSTQPIWFVGSSPRRDIGNYSGPLYQTSGPAFSVAAFNTAMVNTQQVGTFTLRFTGPADATLDYTVNGVTASRTITRQTFANVGSLTGNWHYVNKAVTSGCSNTASNGVVYTTGTATIAAGASAGAYSATLTRDGSSASCIVTAAFEQKGSVHTLSNRKSTCVGGTGTAVLRLLDGVLSEHSETTNPATGCTEKNTLSAVR